MRYQQQQARMSPNWREKEAMSTQKLMAATTHLHLKQDEEIMRLRRNVSSLAKKNHGLMRQVHELVSRLRQYPPPRIPEDTRPTNQDDTTQREPPPETEEDTQMEDPSTELQESQDDSYYSLLLPIPRKPMQQQSSEYEILPDAVEPKPTPTPAPRPTPPPIQPQTPHPPPSKPATPKPATIEKGKETEDTHPRVEQTPLPEAVIPADTHLDDELINITILASEDPKFERHCDKQFSYNLRRKEEDHMTIRGWMWYSKIYGEHALCGEEYGPGKENYSIKAIKRRNRCIINLEDIKDYDKKCIAGHNGKYLVGFPGHKGEREKTQIVIR